ncbi:MAG: metal-dependent transcriptional regulator, partial [Actinomycetota bacterium]|nr:metal-dependent transcriptional regulator [Actinomycetota bacterium]
PVTTSGLSDRLGLSASSVSGMIRRLAARGLVDHRPYGGVTLTSSGRAAALQVVRRHRLLEMFLVAELGYGWDEVHDEAEVLEHAVSDRLLERIDVALGRPRFDPHGDPIPGPGGNMPAVDARRLATLKPAETGLLVRVDDSDPEVLRHLTQSDITLGQRLELLAQLPFEGDFLVRTEDGRTHHFAPVLAAALWISENTPSDR